MGVRDVCIFRFFVFCKYRSFFLEILFVRFESVRYISYMGLVRGSLGILGLFLY